jgi:uncharacterized protein with PIN domain
MGVPCPGCGRSYDVALFQFGRTIDCRCGRRVGLEPRIRSVEEGALPRFMVDAMLGRLARWLRILGYDVAWEEQVSDQALVRRALEEARIIVTRDRALTSEWRISDVLVLRSDDPVEQLRELAAVVDLRSRAQPFMRCSRRNERLVPAPRPAARGRVPARVLASGEPLKRCPGCDRHYWAGSHTARMRRVLEEVVGPMPGEAQ